MKKWYECSEAWASIVPALFGILVTTGVLTPSAAGTLQQNIMTIVGALMVIVPTLVYSNNRTELKKSVINAVSYESELPADPAKATIAGVRTTTLEKIQAAGI